MGDLRVLRVRDRLTESNSDITSGRLQRRRDLLSQMDRSAVVHPVLRHRVLITFQADTKQFTADDVIDMLLKEVPVASKGSQ